MTEPKAQEVVVIAALITVGSTTSAYLRKPNKESEKIQIHRTIIGGFAAMFVCSILVEINPDLGGYLAMLIAGGAFIKYGAPTAEAMLGQQKPTKAATTNPVNPRVQLV